MDFKTISPCLGLVGVATILAPVGLTNLAKAEVNAFENVIKRNSKYTPEHV